MWRCTLASPWVYYSKYYELETVLSSNLRYLITPELILQLTVLKEHLGIKSFKELLFQ